MVEATVWGIACREANRTRQARGMGGRPVTIGAALGLIVVGAILRFGITASTPGISVHRIGDIVMIAGAIGVVLWLIVWAPWARRRRVVYREDVPPGEVLPPGPRPPAATPYEDDYLR
jgi:hypothetical protein